MTTRNTPPPTIYEALRRLLACNKKELAERLGVNAVTLRRWEAHLEASHEESAPMEHRAANDLLAEILLEGAGVEIREAKFPAILAGKPPQRLS